MRFADVGPCESTWINERADIDGGLLLTTNFIRPFSATNTPHHTKSNKNPFSLSSSISQRSAISHSHLVLIRLSSVIKTMEWYFAKEVEDLVVPKDYEQTSPENWSQWEMNGFGASNFPKKNLNSNINMTREELAFNGGKNFYTSIDTPASNNGTSKSNNSSMSQELYNNGSSLLWNDQADFQQFVDEEARINHMDDIFFNSLLEKDPTKESTESQDNTILENNANIFESEMANSQHVGSHGQSIGSSKYLKSHDFSPSTDWGYGEVSTNYQMPKQYTTGNENSMEESVLNDLERVTAQFTDKTRICFRDAFYRLAENSKQPISSCQDEEPMLTSNDDTLRGGDTEISESKTNVIDRAVANLMFHKFDYENQQQLQVVSGSQYQTDYNDDAQVPIQESTQSTGY